MIKHALAMSFVLISAQAIASTPCPTCKKGYVASSLEEALVAQQKEKGAGLKKTSLDSSFSQPKTGENAHPKSPVEILVNQGRRNDRDAQAKPTPYALRSLAPKRDKTLGTTQCHDRFRILGPPLHRTTQNIISSN